MSVLRKYKYFVNEAVDSDKEVKSLKDVPADVIESAKKIASDMFDKVKKPTFEIIKGTGLVMIFAITEQDFYYIDRNEPLTLDMTEGAKKKRTYDVTLTFLEGITETYEVSYVVNFSMFEDTDIEDFDDEDGDVDVEDSYEKIEDEGELPDNPEDEFADVVEPEEIKPKPKRKPLKEPKKKEKKNTYLDDFDTFFKSRDVEEE